MDLPVEYKTLANIKPSDFPIEQPGIIFQDKRLPQTLSFGIAVKDPNKESSIQRSHSICPSKDHFVDKYSYKKNLRYTASPNLGSHVSGSKLEKGRRIELGTPLLNIKDQVADNQVADDEVVDDEVVYYQIAKNQYDYEIQEDSNT